MTEPFRHETKCFVDQLAPMQFEVEAWTETPISFRRTYVLKAKSEQDAAFQGMAQFEAEVEALVEAAQGD